MKSIIFFVLFTIGIGFVYGWQQTPNEVVDVASRPDYELIMYSLTTCGFCKQKVKELKNQRIEFKEYFIDKDNKKMKEVTAKLDRAGFAPQRYGTPIFEANGIMLPNNPKMRLIKSKLGFN
jgi:glutaredoxin